MKIKYRSVLSVSLWMLATTLLFGSDVGINPEGSGWRIDWGFDHSTRKVELKEEAVYLFYQEVPPCGNYVYTKRFSFTELDGEETLDKLFLKVSYGFGDRCALFFNGGMASLTSEFFGPGVHEYSEYQCACGYTSVYEEDRLMPAIGGRGDWGPFLGAGFKGVFYKSGSFRIGLNGQYNWFRQDNDLILEGYQYGSTGSYAYHQLEESKIERTTTSEYQVALVFSRKHPLASPYGGFKVSYCETDYKGTYRYGRNGTIQWEYPFEMTTRLQHFYGFFFGAEVALKESLLLVPELRVGDETAVMILMAWKI